MSTPSTIARQPKGRPVGGQFAALDRAEADVALDAAPTVTEPQPVGLSDEELLRESLILARQAAARANLTREDIEDIAQETVFSVLRTQQKNGGQPITGGLVRIASRALVSRQVDTHARHEDSKAYAMWKRDVERAEATAGRHLSRKELDELATKIRDNWHDPRHRPGVGFQYETKVSSFEADARNLADTYAAPTTGGHVGSDEGHELVDRFEAKELSRAEAARQAWNALSTDLGVAPSIAGSVPAERARRARAQIENAHLASERFLDGDLDDKSTEALFLPFGALTNREKAKIAAELAKRPAVADRLWRSAVDFADTRNNRATSN